MRTIILLLIGFSLCFSEAVTVPTQPDPNDKSTGGTSKNQWGIIGSLTSWYYKVRTCVRYAYDEIKYWEGVVDTYKQIHTFFNDNGNLVKALQDTTTKIFENPKDVFVNLERLETIFNGIDRIAYEEPRRFDEILYAGEKNWDKFSVDTVLYSIQLVRGDTNTLTHTPGILIPNTAQILGFIDRKMFGDSSNVDTSTSSNSIDSVDLAFKDFDNSQRDTSHQDWPETRLRTANELVAAYAMANSAQYRMWSQRSMQKVNSSDRHFADNAKNVNEKELAASWYGLENINANNKRIHHSALEAKVLQSMLGTEIFYKSSQRQSQMSQSIWSKDVANAISTVK